MDVNQLLEGAAFNAIEAAKRKSPKAMEALALLSIANSLLVLAQNSVK